jgi:hypothetical protein
MKMSKRFIPYIFWRQIFFKVLPPIFDFLYNSNKYQKLT